MIYNEAIPQAEIKEHGVINNGFIVTLKGAMSVLDSDIGERKYLITLQLGRVYIWTYKDGKPKDLPLNPIDEKRLFALIYGYWNIQLMQF